MHAQGDLVRIGPLFRRPELVGRPACVLAGSEIPNHAGVRLYAYLLWTKEAGPVAAWEDEVAPEKGV